MPPPPPKRALPGAGDKAPRPGERVGHAAVDDLRAQFGGLCAGWRGGRIAGGRYAIARAPPAPRPARPYHRAPPRHSDASADADAASLAALLQRGCVLHRRQPAGGEWLGVLASLAQQSGGTELTGLAALRMCQEQEEGRSDGMRL